jgi:hypothetical protein
LQRELIVKISLFKAMEKAKEAVRKERLLAKQRDEKNIPDQNPELEGFVIIKNKRISSLSEA